MTCRQGIGVGLLSLPFPGIRGVVSSWSTAVIEGKETMSLVTREEENVYRAPGARAGLHHMAQL